jgi:hypothetical protein
VRLASSSAMAITAIGIIIITGTTGTGDGKPSRVSKSPGALRGFCDTSNDFVAALVEGLLQATGSQG